MYEPDLFSLIKLTLFEIPINRASGLKRHNGFKKIKGIKLHNPLFLRKEHEVTSFKQWMIFRLLIL